MSDMDRLQRRLAEADLPPSLKRKAQALLDELRGYPSAVVAFSGGVDSSLLAFLTAQALGERMVAVTLNSTLEDPQALAAAAGFAGLHGFKHVAIPYDPLQNPVFCANPPGRCYFCKTDILTGLWAYARQNDYQVVLDGQNDDDRSQYRPGNQALAETGTLSPLAYNSLTKAEIRQLARWMGLSIWDRPSTPCLATRIPYGTPVTAAAIQRVAQAEQYLRQLGFEIVRVRYHDELARIEVQPARMQELFDRHEEIVRQFKHIGFLYVTLDLQGYRSGSLDEGLSP